MRYLKLGVALWLHGNGSYMNIIQITWVIFILHRTENARVSAGDCKASLRSSGLQPPSRCIRHMQSAAAMNRNGHAGSATCVRYRYANKPHCLILAPNKEIT